MKKPKGRKSRPVKEKDYPPRRNEIYLGYQTGANIGEIERSPRSNASPYNTRLKSNSMYMQLCCRCFGRCTQGMCSGHAAELHSRVFFAELVLKLADERVKAVAEAMRKPRENGLNLPPDLIEALDELLKFQARPPEDQHPCDEKDQPARKAKHAAEKAAKEAAEAKPVEATA